MKRILYILTAVLSVAACNNAGYGVIDNILYLPDAEQGESATMEVDGSTFDIPVTVRIAQKATEDLKVNLVFDPAILETYNKNNGTEYVHIPVGDLPTDASVVIPAGEVSAVYLAHIETTLGSDATYALAVRLADSDNAEILISNSVSKYIYVFAAPIIANVPVFQESYYENAGFKAQPESAWGVETEDWTIEAWTRMDGYNRNNQAIFTSGNQSKGCEIYVRFGDANAPWNYLQAKILQNNDISTPKNLVANNWYHLAIVCSKAESKATIYLNGEKAAEGGVTYPATGVTYIDGMEFFGAGGSWFVDKCAMSQVRFWKVARTQKEIKDYMYLPINAKSPDLIAFWPMDDAPNEDGSYTFRDASGNGHDATAGSQYVNTVLENVNFKTVLQ